MKYPAFFIPLALLLFAPVLSFAVENGAAYNDWKVQCASQSPDPNRLDCHIFQNLISKDGKNRVLHIAIGYVAGRKDPAAIITLPLGISLPPGIAISVDNKNPKQFPYQACFKTGCQTGFPISGQMLSEFKAGRVAKVKIYDLNNQPIDIPVSLKGFSAAIKAIRP